MLSKFSLLVSFVKSAVKMITVLLGFFFGSLEAHHRFIPEATLGPGGAFRNGTSKGFPELSEGNEAELREEVK